MQPEDKDALIDAKTDLEKALKDNEGNYTEAEKKAIQDEIRRMEAAMEAHVRTAAKDKSLHFVQAFSQSNRTARFLFSTAASRMAPLALRA